MVVARKVSNKNETQDCFKMKLAGNEPKDCSLKTYHPISWKIDHPKTWPVPPTKRFQLGQVLLFCLAFDNHNSPSAVWTWIQNTIHAVSHSVWHVIYLYETITCKSISAEITSFKKRGISKCYVKVQDPKILVAMISSSHLTLLQFYLQINVKHLCTHHLHHILHPLSCPHPYYLTRMKNAYGSPRLPRISIPYRKLYTHWPTAQLVINHIEYDLRCTFLM